MNEIKNNSLFLVEEPKIQQLSQGVWDNKFYFGKVVYYEKQATDSIILSTRHALVNWAKIAIELETDGGKKLRKEKAGENELLVHGFNYSKQLMDGVGTNWSNNSIKQFLDGTNKKIESKELFDEIRSTFDYFMDVHDERILDFISIYTIATYCFSLFNSLGYVFLNCEKESGKTKLMQVMGYMAFNAVDATNPSESALFRICDAMRPTLLVDDFEQVDDEKQKALLQIFKVGYKRGGQTIRVEKSIGGVFTPTIFSVYAPKVLSNTTELDPTTLTRCVVIRLLKTKTSKGSREPDENNPNWQIIRDHCYNFIMENWEAIAGIYKIYSSNKFNNRNLELAKGVLAISKFINQETHDKVESFLIQSFEDRDFQSNIGSWEQALFQKIQENVKTEGWYSVLEIARWVESDILPDKPASRSRWIGRILSKIPSFKHSRRAAGVSYYLSPTLIDDYYERQKVSYEPVKTKDSVVSVVDVVDLVDGLGFGTAQNVVENSSSSSSTHTLTTLTTPNAQKLAFGRCSTCGSTGWVISRIDEHPESPPTLWCEPCALAEPIGEVVVSSQPPLPRLDGDLE